MRAKIVIVALTTLSAAAFIGGGLYHQYGTNARKGTISALVPTVPVTTARSSKGFSFSALKAPRPVPELRFVDGEGHEMTLENFKGSTVLLNIWATWCVPCREEMPALDRLQAKVGGPDFQVVPLSIDRKGLPKVKAFYQELGLTALGIYLDKIGKASRQLGVVGIPTTLLINGEGREIGRVAGPAEWDSDEVVRVLKPYVKPYVAVDERPEGVK